MKKGLQFSVSEDLIFRQAGTHGGGLKLNPKDMGLNENRKGNWVKWRELTKNILFNQLPFVVMQENLRRLFFRFDNPVMLEKLIEAQQNTMKSQQETIEALKMLLERK